ncbi:MAG TPA: type II CAAX endopeptidase family protein [Thermoplasmata archaeon]|nr:type II CAAX endopeptidase family protein [Thermoplasmata archaeon]
MAADVRGSTSGRLVPYAASVLVTVVAVLSQYFLPQLVPALRPVYENFFGDLLVVYGIPIVACALGIGWGPLRGYRRSMARAGWEGLRWYGLLSVLGLLVLFILVVVYEALDPSALNLLNKPNPVIQQASSNPIFWVVFSFVIGAVEETIFRGWIFGFWSRRPGFPWWVHATWTSALFAGVHLYYGLTYGVASPLVYPTLFLLGFAFAATYQASNGNLVVVALLHGGNDAAGFLTLYSAGAAAGVHYLIVLVGFSFAVYQYFQGSPFEPRPPRTAPVAYPAFFAPPPPPPPPPPGWLPPAPVPLPPPPPPPPPSADTVLGRTD